MKKFLFLVLVVVLSSCGSDDGASADPFSSIPSGEIVAVEERDRVLTGEDAAGRTTQTYRWWKQDISKLDFSTDECGEDEDLSQTDTYYAFAPNGDIRVRFGTTGDGTAASSWEWSSTAKDAINIEGETSVDFVIRALNDSEVIYASYQEAQGCSLVTWERFTR